MAVLGRVRRRVVGDIEHAELAAVEVEAAGREEALPLAQSLIMDLLLYLLYQCHEAFVRYVLAGLRRYLNILKRVLVLHLFKLLNNIVLFNLTFN